MKRNMVFTYNKGLTVKYFTADKSKYNMVIPPDINSYTQTLFAQI